MGKMIYLLLLGLISSSCSVLGVATNTATHYTTHSPYDEAETAYSREEGTATVGGKAVYMLGNEVFDTCSNRGVWLRPVSKHADEIITNFFGNTDYGIISWSFGPFDSDGKGPATFTSVDSRGHELYNIHRRKTKCDVGGGFLFRNVPAGPYYVTTSIPTGDELLYLMRRIDVEDGAYVDVDFLVNDACNTKVHPGHNSIQGGQGVLCDNVATVGAKKNGSTKDETYSGAGSMADHKSGSTKERLLQLKELYDDGLIDEQGYKRKRAEILDSF